jgi:hypothetical protein
VSELTSTRGQAMLGYLPRYYESSRVMKSILQAQGGGSTVSDWRWTKC